MIDPTDEQLQSLIVAADDEALQEGTEPRQRPFSVIPKVMEKLGYKEFVFGGQGTLPIVDKIAALHRTLYRPSDLAIGGIHGGIFMFRDVFARVYVPIAFGHAAIDPFTLTDLSSNQLGWLGTRKYDLHMFLDQFMDIFDFGGGIGNYANYKTPPKEALEFFWLAAFQLQGAAASLSVAFDSRGAVQSALIGTELALKGGLAAAGEDKATIRKHGHDLTSAAKAFGSKQSNFDLDRALRAISRMPPYVENRYSPDQPSRIETGHIVMGAQYVAGEVMRQIAGYSIRSANPQPTERVYP